MDSPGIPLTILAFLLVIGPLVFVHELGHYLAARLFGIHAEAFAVGFGREVAGFTDRRGTRWKFGWLPLGGYVKFAGDMNPASQPDAAWLALPPAERARTFQSKPVWQRAIVVAAGPAINFLVALGILSAFAATYGERRTPPVAATVAAGTAAARAGVLPGDRVVSLGGRAVDRFDDVADYVRLRPREVVRIELDRAGRPVAFDVRLGASTLTDRFGNRMEIGVLGIGQSAQVFAPVGVLEAPVVAVRQIGGILRSMTDALGQIVTGQRSLEQLGGPIQIAKVSGERMSLGATEFVFLLALVSINLGFINLLPVPTLDGGHLLFYAIEAVRRRPVGPQVQEWAFRGGLMALLALMLLVTFNDLGSLGLWRAVGAG